jgi:hypothetical protein
MQGLDIAMPTRLAAKRPQSETSAIDRSDAGAVIGLVCFYGLTWRRQPWARLLGMIGLLPPGPHVPTDIWAGHVTRTAAPHGNAITRNKRLEIVVLTAGTLAMMALLLLLGLATLGDASGLAADPFASERGDIPPT